MKKPNIAQLLAKMPMTITPLTTSVTRFMHAMTAGPESVAILGTTFTKNVTSSDGEWPGSSKNVGSCRSIVRNVARRHFEPRWNETSQPAIVDLGVRAAWPKTTSSSNGAKVASSVRIACGSISKITGCKLAMHTPKSVSKSVLQLESASIVNTVRRRPRM